MGVCLYTGYIIYEFQMLTRSTNLHLVLMVSYELDNIINRQESHALQEPGAGTSPPRIGLKAFAVCLL